MDNILNSTVEMSQAELIFQLAKTNVEQEKRLKSTELRLSVLEEEMKKLSSKCIGNYGCSTMSAYVQRHKLPIYVSDIAKLGNDATRLCKKRGYPVNKVNIDRFGVVNVYPDFILHELLDDYIRTTQRLNGSIMR
ncbi:MULTISPECIES: hypothetical protein [Bacteroides]|mgnify:FL=1|jgi:hypothetical protein|uniref:hypothetical protein n=1 Tax=Bacteroides TaxID=816 RepID=UPI0001546600|nr:MULTISPECIES: hypothetical protein [Bacteroides]DAG14949.1 MAG TPA: hypothetical protein [Caudoviricetes sp.]EDM22806.1 hypothetical protein BACCAC_01199 [Bacteroides caccae ATCC 43185]MDC7280909.1 hypothetical protein [Bacteroides caccae]QQT77051.1 hypothetical protein I6I54_12270 [Bacteroides caccae]QRP57701.1 hypothetical protein I6J49_16740 [Bacteroides caccae]